MINHSQMDRDELGDKSLMGIWKSDARVSRRSFQSREWSDSEDRIERYCCDANGLTLILKLDRLIVR